MGFPEKSSEGKWGNKGFEWTGSNLAPPGHEPVKEPTCQSGACRETDPSFAQAYWLTSMLGWGTNNERISMIFSRDP
jgi:hypothetical protein